MNTQELLVKMGYEPIAYHGAGECLGVEVYDNFEDSNNITFEAGRHNIDEYYTPSWVHQGMKYILFWRQIPYRGTK